MAKRVGANISLEWDMTSLLKGPPKLDKALDRGVAGVFEFYDSKIETWMKTNAKWTDRTGAARSGLQAVASHKPMVSHQIDLFYKVPYGIWLEVRFAGRYSIILPAIVYWGPKVMAGLNRLFDKLNSAQGGSAS